tara:strand:- start:310 stop:528 length:219 start_codon:yes stop_codon:yes gene_type:complete
MKYNPMTDFVCYARDKYGDELTTCYKHNEFVCEWNKEGIDKHPVDCHEDRLLTGKSETGCTPSAQTIIDRRK